MGYPIKSQMIKAILVYTISHSTLFHSELLLLYVLKKNPSCVKEKMKATNTEPLTLTTGTQGFKVAINPVSASSSHILYSSK